MILLGYILTFGWVFFVMAVTTVLKKLAGLNDEQSRKVVHVSVAFAWIPMRLCFGATWHLLVPALFFTVFNFLSYKFNILSAMERQDDEKKSLGTVYYAVSMAVMALLCLRDESFLAPYGIGMFCMALGDGLAPILGSIEKGNVWLLHGRRSLYGTLTVFLSCLLVVIVMSAAFSLPYIPWEMLLIALGATVLEFIGVKGIDNLTLPIGVCLLSWLLL